MSKVCIFLAEGFEEIEALTVVDILRRVGIEISCVSVTGQKQVTGSHQITVTADKLIEEVDFEQTDMLVLPGGMPGTLNLEAHEEFMEQVKNFYKNQKWLAAICAAPSIFGHLNMLEGKKACCYPGFEKDLQGADVVFDSVAVSDKMITSRGMGTAIDFALAITAELLSQEEADDMAEKIIYK